MTEYGVTSSGFIPKPFSVILEELKLLAKQELGDDIDLSENSRLLRFLEIVAKREDELWQLAEDIYYSGFVQFATGESLDRVVALLGIRRKQATRAKGYVRFSKSGPTWFEIYIPKGTRVATQDGSVVFRTTQDAILPGATTYVDVPIEAVEPGSQGNVAANTITKLVDPISGIESVTNPEPTTGGRDAETDEELRYRAIKYAPYAKATLHSIKSALLQIEGVTDVNIWEDLESHKIIAVVAGGNEVIINLTIEDVRPAGIPVEWQRPTAKSIDVNAQIKVLEGYDASEVQSNVQNAITNYINGLHIGEDVNFSDLAKVILQVEGVDDIVSLEATDGTNTINSFGQSIAIAETEKAQAGTVTVTVV